MNSETSLPAYKAHENRPCCLSSWTFLINSCETFLCSMSDPGETALCLLQRNREHINMTFLEIKKKKKTGYDSIFKNLYFIQMIM